MNETSVVLAARADLLLLTASMLRAPLPVSAEAHRLQRHGDQHKPAWTGWPQEELSDLLRACQLPPPLAGEISLDSALSEVFLQARAIPLDSWSDEYWRLFDAALACPINEAAYIRRDKGAIIGDLAGFYRAFGWQPAVGTGERPDHLLAQLEFTSALLAMAAGADSEEPREICLKAATQFAQTHLQDWLPSFCFQLCEATTIPFFGAVGQWLLFAWQAVSRAQNWASPEPEPRLAPVRDQENPYECAAGGLVQLGAH